MKKYFLLINVIIGIGCSSTVQQKEVISKGKMVELLTEIHILEASVDKLRLANDSAFRVYNTLERELLEKHNLDKVTYEESYRHYLSQPVVMDQIYAIVVDSLNVIQKRGYKEDTELEQVRPQSLGIDTATAIPRPTEPVSTPNDRN